uniref:7-ethoxycoumarin O-deethylase-like n=1 Tax=Erigeron canadensis TaxID=72917 RepID=UPI001CB93B55|nr:7-ethoxycoumarin O-deethylase-like [Erigeron canadensis]
MDFMVILGLFVSYLLFQATLSVFGYGKPKTLPPGPTRLPIIGNLHLLGDQPHQSLTKLAKIHGPIMSLKLGHITTVVISSAVAAKEVLQKRDLDFSSRHIPDALNAHNHSKYSVAWLPVGTQWRTLRKILSTNIFTTNSLNSNQHLRRQKVNDLIAYCKKASQANESVDIGRAAFRTTMNLLFHTIFSRDLTNPYEDSGKEFKEVVGNIMVEAGKPNLVDYFPIFKKLDPQRIRTRLSHHFGKLVDIFENLINERLGMGGSNQNDVLNMCLKISQENPVEFNQAHIKSLFLDLFAAGTDTTSNTLEWAMTELLRNPLVMEKAKLEVAEVVGKGKIVKEDDILNLPYLSCIVKETLRVHPPVPLLLPRKVENEVNLNGYIIPKGTQVLVNAYAIGRDPTIWEDSLEFNPERFMTSKLDIRGQDFELIPFGAGRRICPGLPLAMRMLHVMLGSLLNNFDWYIDTKTKSKELDMTEKFGLTLQKSISLCVIPVSLN